MLKSYEAIYDNGHLQWLTNPPKLEYAQVMVIIEDPNYDETSQPPTQMINGTRLAKILRETEPNVLASVAEKFGDPIEWQREQRRERNIPGRENS